MREKIMELERSDGLILNGRRNQCYLQYATCDTVPAQNTQIYNKDHRFLTLLMSQIISIHVGGTGVRVGLNFWDQLHDTRNKIEEQDYGARVHFNRVFTETLKGDYVPKAIFVDTDARSGNLIEESKLSLNRSSIGSGSSCCNLFCQGYYLSGCEVTQKMVECVRREVEKNDMLSGFILTSSSTGGAGSGIGANVLGKLRQYYCDRMVEDFRIFPGTDHANGYRNLNHLEVYNALLRTHHEISNTDMTYCFQNNAVIRILEKRRRIHASYQEINEYYAKCLMEHMSWYVWAGALNTNQRKRAVNMVPFPRIKQLCCSLSEDNNYLESALNRNSKLMHQEPCQETGMYAMNINARGNLVSEKEVNEALNGWLLKTSSRFVEWLPNALEISIGQKHCLPHDRAWVISNGRNNIEWLNKVCQLYTGQFRRRAFLYHYINAGMDEMEFTEAQSNCNDLLSEYIPWGTYDEEEEMDLYPEQ